MTRLVACSWIALAAWAAGGAPEEDRTASALFQQHKFAEAGEALDRALQADPKFVPAWILPGRLAMAVDHFHAGRRALERAGQLARDSAQARFRLGCLL